MRILHICISNPYVDNWGYQENLLPKYLFAQGHENYVLAPNNYLPTYLSAKEVEAILAHGDEYEVEGIKVRRMEVWKLTTSFVIAPGLYDEISRIAPDAILHHNLNAATIPAVSRYAKKHHIPLFFDNHADVINCSRNRLYALLYYKCMVRLMCALHGNVVRYYGVTRSRCDFLHDYYGITYDKIGFLPIGADVDAARAIAPKEVLRHRYKIGTGLVVCSGGKMGRVKGTHSLIDAVSRLRSDGQAITLVLFGKFEDDITEMLQGLEYVRNYGWCDRHRTLELLKMSDVACWPIHHTTLCEDAIAVETPLILRRTGTTRHLIDGNGLWLETGSEDELYTALRAMADAVGSETLHAACQAQKQKLGYDAIARSFVADIVAAKGKA